MSFNEFNRRNFGFGAISLLAGLGIARNVLSAPAATNSPADVLRNNAAIHQEVTFEAPVARVYQTLTDAKLFDKVVMLSAAMSPAMQKQLSVAPTTIDAVPGGAFSLFGGYITGRTIELVPNTRLVQAWRVGNWDPGDYSIASFALQGQGAGTKLTFKHTGFPSEDADHLAAGWYGNYWNPIAKSLA